MFQKFNLAIFILIALFQSSCFASTTRPIIDSRGVEVNIPVNIQRISTINDGMIEGIMTAFSVQDKKDITFAAWLLDFCKNVYGVDNETAKKLRSVQWMDWTLEEIK
ncbi:hypothetical protein [Desulfobacula toluolica]|uniref:ABC transporter, substrate-binding protein n=1 Tax=Desulfobacula toluolica (strain DSM 7467 / Tol2) TaxID=651182 RepID=K0NAW1_DESTT|nr:hypothetical protein [Desulfobacula toluolica]CCK81334.1 ABC transporter, substrate-binding protein, fragment [Desulfobacula toluolica Tol2]